MSERIPPGYGEVHFRFRLTGDPETMISSLGFQLQTGYDVANILTNVDLAGSELIPVMTNQYSIGPHEVVLGGATEDAVFVTPGVTFEGSVSADAVTSNTAYLVRKFSEGTGRRSRGRMFIPGVPEGFVNANGVLLTSPFGALVDAVTAMGEALVDGDDISGLVLFHETAPFDPTGIFTLQAQPLVATQRRRMRR